MKRIKVLAVAALAVIASALPMSASANTAPTTTPKAGGVPVVMAEMQIPENSALAYHTPGSCSRAWIRINAHTITARVTKSTSAAAAFTITSPDGTSPMYYSCRSLEPGSGYTACNASNTGWILVAAPELELQGWIVNQCTSDPIF